MIDSCLHRDGFQPVALSEYAPYLTTSLRAFMKTCLIVIDVQESFRHRPFFTEHDLPGYLQAQNALINGCVAQGIPVVRVFHSDGPEVPENPFSQASGQVRALDGLAPFDAAATFTKSRHSALVGTGLDVWLTSHGIQRLIIGEIEEMDFTIPVFRAQPFLQPRAVFAKQWQHFRLVGVEQCQFCLR